MRTRLRRLYTSGREFVWKADIRHVRGERDCHRCIRVRAWGAGKNGRALQADLLSKSWGSPWGTCETDGAYPESGDVRSVIEYARAHGWEPDAIGGTHFLTERDHPTFELPDFVLTDRLRVPTAPDPTDRVIRAAEAG